MLATNKWAVLINPNAGRKNTTERIELTLKKFGIQFDIFRTRHKGHAKDLVVELVEKGFRNFIVVGGDGSVNETINGLMTANINKSELTFAIIPRGTGNDWSRYWKLPKDADKCCQIICDGNTEIVDTGVVEWGNEKKYFINSLGIGFDAKVVKEADSMGSNAKGHQWTYIAALIKSMVRYKSDWIEMKTNETILHDERIFSISIANGPYTGGGIKQTPQACPTDGMFDMMVATKPTPIGLAKGLSTLLLQRNKTMGMVNYHRCTEVDLTCKDGFLVELDGIVEEIKHQNITARILPHSLRMIVPAKK